MESTKADLRIGEVARLSGLTRKALMILEREGALVPERAANGYRLYSEEQARHAGIARRLRDAGLGAAEVRRVMEAKRGAVGRSGKLAAAALALGKARERLEEKRRAVEEAILRLDALIAECRAPSRQGRE